ncbi:MAG: hypothetical protein H0X31_19660, partial [Nostocaceae cyanobacterium]|nr:hypothetical protein [Nostocaceae cyanobacterium]
MAEEVGQAMLVGCFTMLARTVVGVFLGIALFFSSFFLLYWNEGRVNFSELAKNAVEISANVPNSLEQGKLVSLSGNITSNQMLGDRVFLKPGKYIVVNRRVQTFAWVEDNESNTQKNADNSKSVIGNYSYQKKWTSFPEDSSKFKYPQGHENPAKSSDDAQSSTDPISIDGHSQMNGNHAEIVKPIVDEVYKVSDAKIGVYNLDLNNITLPSDESLNELELNLQNIQTGKNISVAGKFVYQTKTDSNNPQVGDIRVHYFTLPVNAMTTVLGNLRKANQISSYT